MRKVFILCIGPIWEYLPHCALVQKYDDFWSGTLIKNGQENVDCYLILSVNLRHFFRPLLTLKQSFCLVCIQSKNPNWRVNKAFTGYGSKIYTLWNLVQFPRQFWDSRHFSLQWHYASNSPFLARKFKVCKFCFRTLYLVLGDESDSNTCFKCPSHNKRAFEKRQKCKWKYLKIPHKIQIWINLTEHETFVLFWHENSNSEMYKWGVLVNKVVN